MDERDWKKFERNFASRAVVVFEEPLLLKPEEITPRMKPMVEYFDSSKHSISDFKIAGKGDRLTADAKVSVTYWKNRTLWRDTSMAYGRYQFEFVRDGEDLKVSRMRFILEEDGGLERYLYKAMTKGSQNLPYKAEVVDFPSANGKHKMRGWLYIPSGNIHDVVVINGNIGSIKEQGPHEYARLMAREGYGALVFDFVNFGESEGDVRNFDNFGEKISDYRAAMTLINTRQEFQAARISLVGIGASAGIISEVAMFDNRVDRLVMIAPWLPNPKLTAKQRPDERKQISRGIQAAQQFMQDGVTTYDPVASFSDKNAFITSDSSEEMDYYTNPERGNIPQWDNEFATMGWSWINYDATANAPRIRIPTVIIQTESDRNIEGTRAYVAKMRAKAEVHTLPVAPYDFYDRPETMKQTVEIVKDFLNPEATKSEVTTL